MRSQRLIALERYLKPPAEEPCRCLLDYREGEPPPPDGVRCDRCGLMRRGKYTLVIEEIIVTPPREEAQPR
jgi:hypothetical protein